MKEKKVQTEECHRGLKYEGKQPLPGISLNSLDTPHTQVTELKLTGRDLTLCRCTFAI